MKTNLLIELSEMRHLSDRSSYNHNYYELPFTIDGSKIVIAKSDDDMSTLWFTESGLYLGETLSGRGQIALAIEIKVLSEYPT
jgi:hypothetical protein